VAWVALSALAFSPCDELSQVLRWQRVPTVDDHGLHRHGCNGRKVPLQIERKVVDRAIENMRARIAQAQRVAIRGRAHGTGGGDPPCATGRILDDDRLAKSRPHGLGHDASDRVGGAAGRKRYDHGDRA